MEVLIKLNPAEAMTAIDSGAISILLAAVHDKEQGAEKIIRAAKEEAQASTIEPAPSTPVYNPPVYQQPAPQGQPTQPVPTYPTAPTQPVSVPTAAPTYSMEQLAVAATQLVDAGRRTELVALLGSFGVQALTALPKEQYGAFATQLRSMGAKI